MRVLGRAVLAAVVITVLLAHGAQAGLTRVAFDVWTTNYPDPDQKQLNVWIPVSDGHNNRGPDFVKSIKVTAPDGSVFSLHPTKDWLQYDGAYWKALYAADFKGGQIAAGTYKVRVVPKAGSAIAERDAVNGSFLPIPVVTSPSNGANGIGRTLDISWKAVAGATYYRVQLWDNSWNEPVYWTWGKQLRTDLTTCQIPVGELQPNRQYRLRIEARSGTQDLDMRSRSDWITFNTGSW